jgi:hypothetical protein
MNDTITNIINDMTLIFEETDNALNSWDYKSGNMPFPTLIGIVAAKIGWNKEQTREADAMIRYYVHKSQDWYSTRGAKGGIMPMTTKIAKDQDKAVKDQEKLKARMKIEEKLDLVITSDLD